MQYYWISLIFSKTFRETAPVFAAFSRFEETFSHFFGNKDRKFPRRVVPHFLMKPPPVKRRGLPAAQRVSVKGQVDHFQAGTGQTGVGADDIGAVLGVPDGLCRRCLADEHLISARLHTALWDAIAGGGVALRVEIYDKHLFAQCRYSGRKVDGGGGFAHSALLVCDRYNFCHALFFLPGKDLFHMEHAVVPAGFPVRQTPWFLV